MAETIKGGAYQSADGKWRDANGKEISSKQVAEFEELQAGRAEELAQAEAVTEAQAVEAAPVQKSKRTTGKPKDKDKAKG